jgi:hypothetical protein
MIVLIFFRPVGQAPPNGNPGTALTDATITNLAFASSSTDSIAIPERPILNANGDLSVRVIFTISQGIFDLF